LFGDESLEVADRAAAVVHAELEHGAALFLSSRDDPVVVHREPRPAQDIGMCIAGEPFDLELEPGHQRRRIDDGEELATDRRISGQCRGGIRRAHRGVEARRVGTVGGAEREAMRGARADAQATHQAARAKGIVARVEVDVAMRGPTRLAAPDAEWQHGTGKGVELRGGPKLVARHRHALTGGRSAQCGPTQRSMMLRCTSRGDLIAS
jgi:hypothetical protein